MLRYVHLQRDIDSGGPSPPCKEQGVDICFIAVFLFTAFYPPLLLSVQEGYVCTGHSACRSAKHSVAVLPQQPQVLGHEREG